MNMDGSNGLTGNAARTPRFPPRVGALTDVGRVREFNEDNLRWDPLDEQLVMVAVADGMGGHDRGEVASELAVTTLFSEAVRQLDQVQPADADDLQHLMHKAFQTANRMVVTTGRENDSNMGTTLCAALVRRNGQAVVSNVGDSRVYRLRGSRLEQVSRDHSLVSYLVQMGELTPAQARNHPSGNILVRSVGSVAEVEIDLFPIQVEEGDRLILCSDGLWGELTDEEIRRILLECDEPQDACERMVAQANRNGGRDNVTVIVMAV